MAIACQGHGSPSSPKIAVFNCKANVIMIFHGLIYISFRNIMSLWSWLNVNGDCFSGSSFSYQGIGICEEAGGVWLYSLLRSPKSLLLALCSRITPDKAEGPYHELCIQIKSVTCNANILPTIISFWPFQFFKYVTIALKCIIFMK